MEAFIFKIGSLAKNSIGTRETFHLQVDESFEAKEFTLTAPLNVDLTFTKTDTSIHVQAEDIKTTAQGSCIRCLKPIPISLHIKSAERNFFFKKPDDPENSSDTQDIFLVETKHLEIDLTEMMRQEIILHFEPFPLCSPACKGVCLTCGIDRNKATCAHTDIEKVETAPREDTQTHQPLKHLKQLL